MKTRLCNIFETTNGVKFIKAISESPYKNLATFNVQIIIALACFDKIIQITFLQRPPSPLMLFQMHLTILCSSVQFLKLKYCQFHKNKFLLKTKLRIIGIMEYKRFLWKYRIIENKSLWWLIKVLNRRLYPTGVSASRMIVALCCTQWVSPNIVVFI